MYPPGEDRSITIETGHLGTMLCGANRPGHFNGVALVVMKLFQIVQADVAVFGEKDYQQLLLIRHLVKRFNLALEIASHPTVREANGLAISSRNARLNGAQKKEAGFLYQTLLAAGRDLRAGLMHEDIERRALMRLRERGWRPDYFSIRRADNLMEADRSCKGLLIAAAACLGKVRLIDNLPVSLKP